DVPAAMNDADLCAETVRELAREQRNVLAHFTSDRPEALAAVMENNSRLAATARLDVFDGDILLFSATRQTLDLDRSLVSPQLWTRYCSGSIDAHDVDAEHHRMMTPDALEQMRRRLSGL